MPIYEYKCNACDHRLEKLQRMSDDPLRVCPDCGQEELTKLVSAAGFRLTGTGWYETDFKNKGSKPDSGSSSGSSSDSSSDS
ncbi:zinc ribbon domain-containing protein [Aliikangiella marina]|uniref:Zinc ribbon domain-containing protein n=1 Tax=Aliikangiella marina TaxID=1712262 RepID=A0A545TGY7_9GAMM|nr:zinc ribbon domain-containing protein [Aliikangiella marina]TQV76487.1 zinc ribbon domain-containing protein [Aliikangiella marina]